MLTRYSRNVKIRRSRSGSEIVCWRVTNNATHAIPTSTGAHTSGSVSPMLAAAVKPSSSPPKPKVEKTSDVTSRWAAASFTSRSRTTASALTISTADAHAKMRNIARQLNAVHSAPPTTGPILGANPRAMPAIPIAVPWRFSGKRVMAIVCSNGMSTPVPSASSTRPTMSIGKLTARQSHNDPMR